MSERSEGPEGIEYEVLDYAPPEAVVGRIFRLYEEAFGEGDQAHMVEELSRRTTVMAVLAREDVEIIGFKLGFEDEPGVYRSWMGAVTARWRDRGVGARMLALQHAWCEENGYEAIRTAGFNAHKEMLKLNLSHGFDVVGTRTPPESGELEILLEKKLHPAGPPEEQELPEGDEEA